jgi:hypothetical protein
MLETHIVMSSLIFRLVLTLVLHLTLLVLCRNSLMDLTITHMVLVHKARVLIVVIISCVGLVFQLEGPTITLSPNTWTIHIFPVVVHVPLG